MTCPGGQSRLVALERFWICSVPAESREQLEELAAKFMRGTQGHKVLVANMHIR